MHILTVTNTCAKTQNTVPLVAGCLASFRMGYDIEGDDGFILRVELKGWRESMKIKPGHRLIIDLTNIQNIWGEKEIKFN